jgi:hypothetical protein
MTTMWHSIRVLLKSAAVPAVSVLSLLSACGDEPRRVRDDFCHGERDGLKCDDGNPCTTDDRCGQGVCLGRPAIDCSGLDDQCVVGACDPDTVECVPVPREDGSSCEDGDLCTTGDTCTAGACGGEAVTCPGDSCEVRACNPETGECEVNDVLEDGTVCEDADVCTGSGACDGGRCVTEVLDCSDLDAPCARGVCDGTNGCVAVEFEDGDACEDGNPCSTGETCQAGACGGATLAPDGTTCEFADKCKLPSICQSGVCDAAPVECPPPPPCYVAVCDSETGACSNEVLEDGSACDDRDACTSGETCSEGVCGNGDNLCFCRDKDDGTPCDDGQRCTAVDVCTDGACIGKPISCTQLDDGYCMVGSCDPQSGECIAVPKPTGTTCDDGKACTSLDRCVNGNCTGDVADCTGEDDACNVGVCAEGTGCKKQPRPDDTRCEDGSSCTGGDVCKAGTCAGGLDVCGPCEGRSEGASCEDGDPCSQNSICVMRAGDLRCEGVPVDCSALSSTCVVGVCDAATGGCVAKPRAGQVTCDDGNACTQLDSCVDGGCRGSVVPYCGASVQACEPAADNDSMERAVIAPPIGQTTTVLGWIDPIAEIDWWELTVPAGVRLTIETRSHCLSELDTLLGLYRKDGSLVAEDDDSGALAFSKVSDILTTKAETFKLGVTTYNGPTGSYLITITTEVPPPCRTDADCTCGDYMCVTQGPTAGKCVPRMPAETPGNAAPELATDTVLGGEVHATLEDPSEVDWYAVHLEAGVPVKIGTRPFCADGLETQVSLYASDAVTELGYAFGNGVAGHALIERFNPDMTDLYYVRVESMAASVGPYVLYVSSLLCTNDSQCACGDQVCLGRPGAPGECGPALSAGDSTVGQLDLGARMYGAIDRPLEVDHYVMALSAGRYDVETVSFCGTAMDTELELRDPSGAIVAVDEDSGEGFMAAISNFEVPAAGTWEVRVSGRGPMVGPYLVIVRPSAAPSE